jgi:hypothetical protein
MNLRRISNRFHQLPHPGRKLQDASNRARRNRKERLLERLVVAHHHLTMGYNAGPIRLALLKQRAKARFDRVKLKREQKNDGRISGGA